MQDLRKLERIVPEALEHDYIDARIKDVETAAARLRWLLGFNVALILVSENSEPTLALPFRVPPHQEILQVGRIYTSGEFLSALRSLPSGGGLRLDAEMQPGPELLDAD